MATKEQKAFCVLQFAKTESVVTVQRSFRIKFRCDAPSDNNIRRWYHQFEDTGCLCKGKSTGRPRVSDECVDRVRDSFTNSSKKSVREVSRELAMPVSTVWRILRRRLQQRPHRLQLLHALKTTDYGLRAKFANEMLHDEDFLDHVSFINTESTHEEVPIPKKNSRLHEPGTSKPNSQKATSQNKKVLTAYDKQRQKLEREAIARSAKVSGRQSTLGVLEILISSKLKNMSREQRLFAENVINQALFKGLLGQLSVSSQIFTQS